MSLPSSKPGVGLQGEHANFPASLIQNSRPKADHANQPYLDVPLQSFFARSSDTLSHLSTYSADNENERRTGQLPTLPSHGRLLSTSPAPLPPRTWKETLRLFWARNKGLALVVLAQLFGVMMNVTIRLLEMSGTAGPGMHPFQVRPDLFLSPIRPPDTLGSSLTMMTDLVRPNDRHAHPQRHLSMVGSGRRCALWIAAGPGTLDCTRRRRIFRR